jgi:hypothetical protein
MERNRVAAGVVMVPCVLLGAAFLTTAVWTEAAGENRPLAAVIGVLLMLAGLASLRLPAVAEADLPDPVTKPDGVEDSP